MGALVAVAIVWWFVRDGDPKVRKTERRLFTLGIVGSILAVFDAVFNADKYQDY